MRATQRRARGVRQVITSPRRAVLNCRSALPLSSASWQRNTMIRKILCIVLGLSMAAAASAGVYSWTDAQGHIHYSDKPAAGAQPLDIRTEPTDPQRIAAQQKQSEEQQAAEADTQKKADEAAQLSAEDEAKRAENCQKAHVRLSAIMGAQRPYRTSADGERHYLSAEEIDAEIKEAESGVSQWCGN
jgi:Domain of unknown function (DUF4124)